MSGPLVGTSKNGLNSKITKPLAKPTVAALNHTKPTTKKLVIKNLKGMLSSSVNFNLCFSVFIRTKTSICNFSSTTKTSKMIQLHHPWLMTTLSVLLIE